MCNRIIFLGMNLPTYGCITCLGSIFVFVLGVIITLYRKLSICEYIKLFFYGGIAAVIGAKFLNMITNAVCSGNWVFTYKRFKDSGYSFYGGLLFGLFIIFIVARIYAIDLNSFSRYFTFLIPLLHAIWKFGCYMGGCCYGIPYSGFGAVTFPKGVMAPSGVRLFPVQLLEMGLLIVLAVMFLYMGVRNTRNVIFKYLIYYAIIRFFIEFLRENTFHYFFSIAQWVSLIILLIISIIYLLNKKYKGAINK